MRTRQLKRQEGVAAVELAIIYVTMFAIIPFIFLFGRVFMHYNVLKHAAFDAANYVASSGTAKLMAASWTVKANAAAMVENAARSSGNVSIVGLDVDCRPSAICSEAETIRVLAAVRVEDVGFFNFNYAFLDEYGQFTFYVIAEVPNASRQASL